MAWVVGVDEAGYGPNLGPLVQAAVAVRLPPGDPSGWPTLGSFVRRAKVKPDARVLVDDSKKVHAGPKGFDKLERSVAALLVPEPTTVGEWLGARVPAARMADLRAEAWFAPDDPLPTQPVENVLVALGGWPADCPVRCWLNVVPAPQFNRIAAGAGTKAAVLTEGVLHFFAAAVADLPGVEPILLDCDKLGGRNSYGQLVRAAFPGGRVATGFESADHSEYAVEGLGRPVGVTFRPRADGDSLPVALASMAAKYVREVCMRQFNRFWAGHVPGLKPTAGYPVDAVRFWAAIRPTAAALGLPDDAVWRAK